MINDIIHNLAMRVLIHGICNQLLEPIFLKCKVATFLYIYRGLVAVKVDLTNEFINNN